jgi:hypothetical protein
MNRWFAPRAKSVRGKCGFGRASVLAGRRRSTGVVVLESGGVEQRVRHTGFECAQTLS